jgi:hypothetical protein
MLVSTTHVATVPGTAALQLSSLDPLPCDLQLASAAVSAARLDFTCRLPGRVGRHGQSWTVDRDGWYTTGLLLSLLHLLCRSSRSSSRHSRRRRCCCSCCVGGGGGVSVWYGVWAYTQNKPANLEFYSKLFVYKHLVVYLRQKLCSYIGALQRLPPPQSLPKPVPTAPATPARPTHSATALRFTRRASLRSPFQCFLCAHCSCVQLELVAVGREVPVGLVVAFAAVLRVFSTRQAVP